MNTSLSIHKNSSGINTMKLLSQEQIIICHDLLYICNVLIIKIHCYYHANSRDPYDVELLLVKAADDEEDVLAEDSRVSITNCHPE